MHQNHSLSFLFALYEEQQPLGKSIPIGYFSTSVFSPTPTLYSYIIDNNKEGRQLLKSRQAYPLLIERRSLQVPCDSKEHLLP